MKWFIIILLLAIIAVSVAGWETIITVFGWALLCVLIGIVILAVLVMLILQHRLRETHIGQARAKICDIIYDKRNSSTEEIRQIAKDLGLKFHKNSGIIPKSKKGLSQTSNEYLAKILVKILLAQEKPVSDKVIREIMVSLKKNRPQKFILEIVDHIKQADSKLGERFEKILNK